MSLKYDFQVDEGNKRSVYSWIIRWSGRGRRILDVGCDTGNLGGYLKGLGNAVDGVEMDPEAAGRAKSKLDRVYTGSAEDPELLRELSGPYDVVVFADVLEHIADPASLLRKVAPLLAEAGFRDVRVSPRMVYVDASRPGLVEGFTRNTFIAMVEGVREKALSLGLVDEGTWEKGIAGLRRTTAPDGIFCYTFFKGFARK